MAALSYRTQRALGPAHHLVIGEDGCTPRARAGGRKSVDLKSAVPGQRVENPSAEPIVRAAGRRGKVYFFMAPLLSGAFRYAVLRAILVATGAKVLRDGTPNGTATSHEPRSDGQCFLSIIWMSM